MRTIILLIIFNLIAKLAWANGERVGNGGDVVVCKQVKDILDFYENAGAVRAFASEETREKVLDEVLRNLDRISPRQAKQYRRRASEFMSDTEFKKDVALADVKDSKHLFAPKDKDCSIEQIAIRRQEKGLDGKRFLVDEELWNQLSPRGQAGLIMHEVIYEHLYKL